MSNPRQAVRRSPGLGHDTKENRNFIRNFIHATGANSLLTSEGNYTPELESRLQRALLGVYAMKTKNGRQLITDLIEKQSELGIGRQLKGVMQTAGNIIRTARTKPVYDLRSDIGQALSRLLQFKQSKQTLENFENRGLLDLGSEFAEDTESPEAKRLFHILAPMKSAKQVSEFINEYSDLANKQEVNTADMFGGKPYTKLELIDKAADNIAKREAENNSTLFDQVKYSIQNVWTGSAADYDKPSLQYIGTGEGAQVYGWGLYGSSSRDVARWYAENDVENKNLGAHAIVNGRSLSSDDIAALKNGEERYMIKELIREGSKEKAIEYEKDILKTYQEGKNRAIKQGKKLDPDNVYDESIQKAKDRIAYLENEIDSFEYKKSSPRNLYRQTFFNGKNENLLDWEKPITEEQGKQILDTLAAEGKQETMTFVNRELKKYDIEQGIESDPEEIQDDKYAYFPKDVLRDELERWTDFYEASGEYVYKQLTEILGSPKAASEFLYRSGIDGIKYIGETSGIQNYVAFSDKDIKVDEHIKYSLQQTDQDYMDAVENEKNGHPSILYADKKIEPLLRSEGVQFPNSLTFGSVIHNIADIRIKVKPQTETLQFKRWFGDSKVVDEDGKPLVVYHNSGERHNILSREFARKASDVEGVFFAPNPNSLILLLHRLRICCHTCVMGKTNRLPPYTQKCKKYLLFEKCGISVLFLSKNAL